LRRLELGLVYVGENLWLQRWSGPLIFELLFERSKKSRRIHDSNVQAPHGQRQLMRVNSENVLDEGLRIEGRGRRMNSKVGFHKNKANIVYWE
jgi:hypothetical protein